MNKELIDSIQNYLDGRLTEGCEDLTLKQIVIVNRMILRFQMEVYNEAIELYRKNLDILGMLAQKLEIIGGQLTCLERRFKREQIMMGGITV